MSERALKIASTKDVIEQMKEIDSLLDEYCKNPSQWSGKVIIDDRMKRWGSHNRKTHDFTLRTDSPIKTKFHELIHARTVFQDPDIPIQITNKYKPLNEAITEVAARGICKAEGVQVLNLSYPKYVRRFRNIASIMDVDELKLSLSLIDMPYERRYDWIKQMLDMLNSNNEITIRDFNEAVNSLQGLVE